MPTPVLTTLLAIALAGPGDEIAEFRESVTTILFEKGLGLTDDGSFVCLHIDGKQPDPALLARLQATTAREIGPPSQCECKEREPAVICNRVGSMQPACSVSISDLKFHSFENATGQFVASCGWPRGGGEVARFQKRDGRWHYAGTSGFIVL